MRILVVEDEKKLALAIARALKHQSYAVDIAYDGDSGLDLGLSDEFDLIILDHMLPGQNGQQVCQYLRQNNIHTPILMLTARDQIGDKVSALDAGADDYMVKPFSFEELFARIRALIRRPHTTTENKLIVHDLTLDPSSFQVTRSQKNIDLSVKEFAILEYLLRHKNSIVSRENLITHVWDYDAEVLPNVVEVHIKNLRDKIDKPFDLQIIQTVRGRGYIIKD